MDQQTQNKQADEEALAQRAEGQVHLKKKENQGVFTCCSCHKLATTNPSLKFCTHLLQYMYLYLVGSCEKCELKAHRNIIGHSNTVNNVIDNDVYY